MDNSRLFLEAIARRLRVSALYNRGRVTLAPHILYTRHGELYVDAVTLDRDGVPPREAKLGAFKLLGLTEPSLEEERFSLFPGFDAGDPKYAGVTLFAVEPA